jgi:hypothetical protein
VFTLLRDKKGQVYACYEVEERVRDREGKEKTQKVRAVLNREGCYMVWPDNKTV